MQGLSEEVAFDQRSEVTELDKHLIGKRGFPEAEAKTLWLLQWFLHCVLSLAKL